MTSLATKKKRPASICLTSTTITRTCTLSRLIRRPQVQKNSRCATTREDRPRTPHMLSWWSSQRRVIKTRPASASRYLGRANLCRPIPQFSTQRKSRFKATPAKGTRGYRILRPSLRKPRRRWWRSSTGVTYFRANCGIIKVLWQLKVRQIEQGRRQARRSPQSRFIPNWFWRPTSRRQIYFRRRTLSRQWLWMRPWQQWARPNSRRRGLTRATRATGRSRSSTPFRPKCRMQSLRASAWSQPSWIQINLKTKR